MNERLQKSIIKTLAFFDIGDYPLTAEELFAYLWQPPKVAYEDFLKCLDEAAATGIIGAKYSYYFLSGREAIVETRRQELVATELKLKIARKAAKKLRSIPFLKAVFVCNSVGFEQAHKESDIDFFIVAQPRRVWIVRFFANVILRFYRLRTHGACLKDRVCLCFFADSEHLNLSLLRFGDNDIYLTYWLAHLIPLYDPENVYQRIIDSNEWMRRLVPRVANEYATTYRYRIQDSALGKAWKKLWQTMWRGNYGDMIEQQVKTVQWQKLPASIRQKSQQGDSGVVITDHFLKFHENDRRKWYYAEWQKRIEHSAPPIEQRAAV